MMCVCKKLKKPPFTSPASPFWKYINLSTVSLIKAEKAFSQTLELIFPNDEISTVPFPAYAPL